MRAGLRSRSEIIESEGRDPDEVNRDIALDAQKRKDLGIVSDGDPSQVSLSGTLQAVMEAE
jgi:capsid protein